ncbi:YARHG domain-containing protein [Pedobacter frigiditerrae]|uniref:YARHG domain-containing protein n=1 Tax=Pedobacter frigiditerrae TaxID=2530452 RepID=UPI00292F96E6|nr:YARHG domain-containing protein [Pedobacter frigiditerrae]
MITILLFACTNKESKPQEETVQEQTQADKNLNGFWVGDFVAEETKDGSEFVTTNKLNIAIKSIINDTVSAQSIVAGNKRPLSGKINRRNGKTTFNLAEPGDDKYDGTFEFELVGDSLIGFWKAYNTNLPVTKRSFKLVRKEFSYNPNLMLSSEGDYTDYVDSKSKTELDTLEDGKVEEYTDDYYRQASESVYTLNSSTKLLTEKELKNLKKLDLEILRNTIFARHGYTFKKKSFRQFFDPVEWYVPVSDNIDGELTAVEKTNIKLLTRFEKYATDNYDTFGR